MFPEGAEKVNKRFASVERPSVFVYQERGKVNKRKFNELADITREPEPLFLFFFSQKPICYTSH